MTVNSQRQKLSIICPVYNEEVTVPLFFARLKPVVDKLKSDYDVELFFVDNFSDDQTLIKIYELSRENNYIRWAALSNNVGYQRSVTCGLAHATGDLMVVIDVDCEDPPEMIVDFIREQEAGYDIVFGIRADREESWVMKNLRKIFYRVTSYVSDENFILDMAEFCLITREVRDSILNDNNSFPFIRASIGRVGFKRKGIAYKRQRRIAGKTHYNLFRMTTFAVAGILSSSTLMLRVAAYSLPFWMLGMVGLSVLWWNDLTNTRYAILLLLLGFLFFGYCLASIAIYLARTYKNTLQRPNFHIRKASSFLPSTKAEAKNEHRSQPSPIK